MRTNNAKESGGGSPLRDDSNAEHPWSARANNSTKSFEQLSLFGLPENTGHNCKSLFFYLPEYR